MCPEIHLHKRAMNFRNGVNEVAERWLWGSQHRALTNGKKSTAEFCMPNRTTWTRNTSVKGRYISTYSVNRREVLKPPIIKIISALEAVGAMFLQLCTGKRSSREYPVLLPTAVPRALRSKEHCWRTGMFIACWASWREAKGVRRRWTSVLVALLRWIDDLLLCVAVLLSIREFSTAFLCGCVFEVLVVLWGDLTLYVFALTVVIYALCAST